MRLTTALKVYYYRWRIGGNALKTKSRLFFEYVILNYISQLDFSNVLFIGVERYTTWYKKIFVRSRFYTLDYDSNLVKYADEKFHAICKVEDMQDYYDDGFFNLIILNGVYGWGLNKDEQLTKAIENIYCKLELNGVLIFGYNNVRENDPCGLGYQLDKYFDQSQWKPIDLGYGFDVKMTEYNYHRYLTFMKI